MALGDVQDRLFWLEIWYFKGTPYSYRFYSNFRRLHGVSLEGAVLTVETRVSTFGRVWSLFVVAVLFQGKQGNMSREKTERNMT